MRIPDTTYAHSRFKPTWEYWIEVRAWEAKAEIRKMVEDALAEIDERLGFVPPF